MRVVLIGDVHARLTIEGDAPSRGRTRRCRARCECGAVVEVDVRAVRSGNTKSCGCLKREVLAERNKALSTHGESHFNMTPEYSSWIAMRRRCLNPNMKAWPNYGGRGITICDRSSSFENFLADMGRRPEGHSLDRIDSNGNYEPANCRWATAKQQGSNRRVTTANEVDRLRAGLAALKMELGR